ncbi:MAG: mismatch-specific DNA-glycosylase [Chitinophagaceae bacterium]|nr:mismatch-specific DNA-glycosylase [Chitinophagaceae bacterium]
MLKDVLIENLDVVFCGTAKGKASATKGFYYAGPGNKFYAILHQASFTPTRLLPTECYTINNYGIGLTDLVHTESGNDNQIRKESYEIDLFLEK